MLRLTTDFAITGVKDVEGGIEEDKKGKQMYLVNFGEHCVDRSKAVDMFGADFMASFDLRRKSASQCEIDEWRERLARNSICLS